MKLFHNPMSHNSRRVNLVIAETGMEIDAHVVDFMKGEHMQADFLAINPNHKIPALVDGDLKLWESSAICQYIAAKAGRTDLWPTDPAEQADVSRWMIWNHTHMGKPVGTMYWEVLLKPMMGRGEPDKAAVEAATKDFRTQAAVLDGCLANSDWLACDRLTLADLGVVASLSYAVPAGLPLADYPNFHAWFARMAERDSWKATAPPRG